MICEGCGIDKTVTVETTIGLARVNARTGNTKLETRTRRLCVPCGGGLKPDEVSP